MAWDDVKEGSGNYVNLADDGASAMVVIVGEPVLQMVKREDGSERKSYLFNAVVGEDEKAKLLRCGVRLAGKIRDALTSKGSKVPGDLAGKVALTLTRHGKKGDTATTYDVKVSKLTPAEVKGLAKVELNDLAKVEPPEESAF
jgi:hypothetical protein